MTKSGLDPINALVPRPLKRAVCAKLALEGRKLTEWLREQLTIYVETPVKAEAQEKYVVAAKE